MEKISLNDYEDLDDTESIEEKYKAIDDCEELPYSEKRSLVGILVGVKPAAEIEIVGREDEVYYAKEDVEMLLDELELAYQSEALTDYYEPGYYSLTYRVAKDEETLQRLQKLRENYKSAETPEETQAIERELGLIFGYPATAVDYFVTEWDPDNHNNPSIGNEKYHSYIHSLAHAEEEYAQYEQIIDGAFRKHCPKSTNRAE